MKLRADTCVTDTGVVIDPYYVHECEDWVHIVAFDNKDCILLIKQYRHGAGEVAYELPCGCVEKNEDPAAAMMRELREETGCVVEKLNALPAFSPNTARYNNKIRAYVGTGARIAHATEMDPTEQIECEFVPVARVLEMFETGEFQQQLHVGSVFMALRQLGYLVDRR